MTVAESVKTRYCLWLAIGLFHLFVVDVFAILKVASFFSWLTTRVHVHVRFVRIAELLGSGSCLEEKRTDLIYRIQNEAEDDEKLKH